MAVRPKVFIVDDDPSVRNALKLLIEWAGYPVETYESAGEFLDNYRPQVPGCLLLDNNMPEMSGLELQALLQDRNISIPVIFITAYGSVPATVEAIKRGAVDFLEKPFDDKILLQRIEEAIALDMKRREEYSQSEPVRQCYMLLTPREQEVMVLVVKGHSNGDIAGMLEVSSRTVEVHRARILKKMKATGLSELIEMAALCGISNTGSNDR